MTKLEQIIQTVLEQQKFLLAASTYEVRRCYFYQLINLAAQLSIDVPCQKLYDAFTERAGESPDLQFQLNHCIKLIDATAETKALRLDGTLYNEPRFPSYEAADSLISEMSFPVHTIDIGLLIVKAKQEMKYLCLSESTSGQYLHAWKGIYQYFLVKGSTIYSRNTIMKFISGITAEKNSGRMKKWKWKINRKAALVLIEVAENGQFQWKLVRQSTPHCLDDRLEDVRVQYCKSLKERNLSKATIDLHDYVFRTTLEKVGISSIEELGLCTPIHVQAAISGFSKRCNQRSMSTLLPILRHILEYFFDKGLVCTNLSGMVLSVFVQKGHIPSFITTADEGKLLSQLELSSRRTRAIIMLALRLGLRDCDICGLMFQEIDWKKDKIRLIQKKTGEPLVLPLLPDVGNALMDYVLNERPKRNDHYPYVFLREQAPFNRLISAYMSCTKVIRQAGIEPVNRGTKGMHLFRYTLVNRMLTSKISHQIITNTLGHVSKESDKPYLSMEESSLRQCALNFSIIGRKIWEGGDLND